MKVFAMIEVAQLIAFLIVTGLQVYLQWGVSKLTNQQGRLSGEIEATRAEMFRLSKLSGVQVIRFEDRVTSLAATIEAALKVAYLLGKTDGSKGDVPYPYERIASAARKLAEHATQGQELTPDVSRDQELVETDD